MTVTLKGKLPTTSISKSLSVGWQLLPAMALEAHPVSWLTQGLNADQVLSYTGQGLQPATQIEAGRAYFVHLQTAATWSPHLPRDPTTTFVYDGDGGRVKQITASGTTLFLGEVFEKAPEGKTTKYVFAGAQRLAAIDTPPSVATLPSTPQTLVARLWHALSHALAWLGVPSAEAALLPANIRFYHPDHLGSTNLVTDGSGAVVELAEHTPYGSLARHDGAASVPQKFTGQRSDDTTGLYFYHARYYDPTLGRFISPDPIVQDPSDPQTLNRYAYVRNNPLNLVDPSGYSFWSKFFGIIIGVSVAAMTGNPYLGYEYYRAVDREIRESHGVGEAITRTYAVVLAMGAASGPSDSGLNPLASDPKQQAANARQVGELTHQLLDAAYRTHAQETAQAFVQDLGVSAGRAAESIAFQLTEPLGRNVLSASASQTINYLSQLGFPGGLTIPELAGAAPGGLNVDSALSSLGPKTLAEFRNATTPLALALVVNQVNQAYRIPDGVLTFEQRDELAKIHALSGVLKVGAGIVIGSAIIGTGPITFGTAATVVGASAGVGFFIDKLKGFYLRRRGIYF